MKTKETFHIQDYTILQLPEAERFNFRKPIACLFFSLLPSTVKEHKVPSLLQCQGSNDFIITVHITWSSELYLPLGGESGGNLGEWWTSSNSVLDGSHQRCGLFIFSCLKRSAQQTLIIVWLYLCVTDHCCYTVAGPVLKSVGCCRCRRSEGTSSPVCLPLCLVHTPPDLCIKEQTHTE